MLHLCVRIQTLCGVRGSVQGASCYYKIAGGSGRTGRITSLQLVASNGSTRTYLSNTQEVAQYCCLQVAVEEGEETFQRYAEAVVEEAGLRGLATKPIQLYTKQRTKDITPSM